MDLKKFGKYIGTASTSVLLHRARKASLKRILVHEEILEASRKKPAKRRAVVR
jgi:hypothetical protein